VTPASVAPQPDNVPFMKSTIAPNATATRVAAPTCADRLCEVAGRDRAVASRLREQAAQLLKLADGLETNASVAAATAAATLTE
jgi:hypothetical protein